MNDFGKLRNVFEEILDGLQNQKLMTRLGLAQRKFIRDRTRKGTDIEGKGWNKPDYDPKYAKRRQRKTGLSPHPVSLVFDKITGMMQNIDTEVLPDASGVELLFTDDAKRRLAEYHNILGAGKRKVLRPFWGVNETEEQKLTGLVEDEVELILQKLSEE